MPRRNAEQGSPSVRGPVVVAVDGSQSSLAAVAVAVEEARSRRCALRVVHAFIWPLMHVPLGPSELGPSDGGLRHQAERLLDEAAERARELAPELEITRALVTGEPLTVLEAESREATLMVVGSRGLGRFVGLLVGSTAVHLAAHGRCPVLVVRGRGEPTGDVLVGVDGGPTDEAALAFAFAAASRYGVGVTALHAWDGWSTPVELGPGDPHTAVYEKHHLQHQEERLLAEAVSGRRATYPDVPVERRLVRDHPRQALIEASGTARLLVVGARGRGGFTGLLLGSVSQAVLQHARCPVAVVRADGQGR
ncbi:universal stress protein [Streptomyces chumphonensis]|uniref:Universal stress protein n=1 Tax=Streptomyces chumphonensis TaxID=1214925 RepID=A0A927F013_9ACTN|nr:universal stress protein [Streptomyces chumphonensis]